MMTTFSAETLITSSGTVPLPVITIEDGLIADIRSRRDGDAAVTHEFPGGVMAAGFLDIHMHGATGHDVMEGDANALNKIGRYLARAGVTEYLATTVTASMETTLRALDGIAKAIEQGAELGAAEIAGIHIEGPFVSHAKRGMHPADFIVPPTPALLDRLWEASRGRIRLMTIAPEVPGAIETIRHARQLGIRASVGHSDATRAETVAAIEAGATSATHTFNAMRTLGHREPGILGVVLDREDLYADLICDGLHVSAEAVRLWLKAKGPERAILITDSLEATGMPDGRYKLGDTAIIVQNGTCTTEAGVLAGSVITLDTAVRKLQEFTGTSLATAVRLASANPARMLGIGEALVVGAPANFNVFDGEGRRSFTVVRGRLL